MWLVGVGEIYGCGSKEVYRFLILLIPTPLGYICSFLQQHPYFFFISVSLLYSYYVFPRLDPW